MQFCKHPNLESVLFKTDTMTSERKMSSEMGIFADTVIYSNDSEKALNNYTRIL